MELIVDTSIVFSLFKSDSSSVKILKEHKIELFAPKKLIDELNKYSDVICSKAGISKKKFLKDISLLPELIELKDASPEFKTKAGKLISDEEDVDFLALALV